MTSQSVKQKRFGAPAQTA